ncbi:MAG: amidohydrolase family protein [Algicola sp.]|nr:amidohydrolase family protein [Algicola sp.]
MKRIKHLLAILCATVTLPLAADLLVIENVTLLSPERQQPLQRANVTIKDGKILAISQGTAQGTSMLAKNAVQIDGTGKYLTPGLMDSHVHVSNMPGTIFEEGKPSAPMQQLQDGYTKQQPRSYLYFGVTQLLDPSQSKSSIVKFNDNRQKPDLFHCGATPILGGYPTMWASQKAVIDMFEYLIYQPIEGQPVPEGIIPALHTPEAVVKRMADDGAICVKVFIEDGFGVANNWPLISNQLLNRVKAAAKKHGLIMMAHANAIDMQKIAQELDVDVIAHGMWNWLEFNNEPGLPEDIRKILDAIIAQKIVFQPTFNVMDGLKGLTVPNMLDDPLYAKVITEDAMKWYHTEAGQWFAKEMIKDFDDMPLERIHRKQDITISQGERVVNYLAKHGLPMVLASDTPSSPTFAAQPGYSTFAELKHLFKAGLTLKQIFEAATINNAVAFGLDDRYGTIEPGKVANLLLLNDNPLQTVQAYNAIDKVIVKGEVIEREDLAVQ